MSSALDGLKIVDVSGSVATGYCAKLFADHGAEVINLEPDTGFPTRSLAPFLPDRDAPEASAMHAYLSTNKSSVRARSMSDDGTKRLIESADLLLDDGASVLPVETCRGVRCSVSWYGLTGPYAGFAGTDAQCYALNGMLRLVGRPEGPPIMPTGYQAQFVGGITAYIASLGQVLAGELGNRTEAVHIDTSIFESTMCFTDVGAITTHNTGLQADRIGVNRLPPTYPLGVFPCRDGWIGLTVLTPRQWASFCALLDMGELADVPLFQSAIGRFQSADVLEPVFTAKLLEHSSETLFYRAQEAGVPLARVPTMEELFEVDQYVERRAFSSAITGDRALTVPSIPFRLLATPPTFGGRVAALGEHDGAYAA